MKEQRLLKRVIKISQNLALLPYQSRYPTPNKEQRHTIAETMQYAKWELDQVEKFMNDDDFDDE